MSRFYLPLLVFTFASSFAAAQTSAPAHPPQEMPTLGSALTTPVLSDLPTGGSLFSILDTVPAEVISDRIDTGGLFIGEGARVGSHGSSWTQTSFRVGDAEVSSPGRSGLPLLVPGVQAWEEVDIRTGLMPIEMNAPGMAVSLVPRQPTTTWTRTFEYVGAGPSLLARQEPTTPPAIARQRTWNTGNVFVSGPLVPGRLGIVFTGGWTGSTRFERGDRTLLKSSLASAFTHLVVTPNGRDQLRVIGWGERARVPAATRIAFGQPLAEDEARAAHVQATWDRRLQHSSFRLTSALTRRVHTTGLQPTSILVVERLSDGPVPELAGASDRSEATWSVGGRVDRSSFTLFDRVHVARGGVALSGASAATRPTFNGRIGELVAGVPARVWQYTSPTLGSVWDSTTFSIYGTDRVLIHPRLALDLGMRFEAVRGSAEGSASRVTWSNWFPRASLRWTLTDYAGIATFAGFSRYGHRLLLDHLAVGDPAAPVGAVYRWTPQGSDPQLAQVGSLVARVGPGTGGDDRFSAIDPRLARPYMDEFVTGFESRPRPGAVIRLAALARREKQLLGLLDVGAPLSAYSTSFVIDPGDDHVAQQRLPVYNRLPPSFGLDRYLLTNAPANRATFVGVELTMQATFRRFFLVAGATAGRSEALSANIGFGPLENDHGVLGEVLIEPNARTFAQGRVFTERGYTIKTAGVWSLPWDMRLGYAARYQDGQHFARLLILDGLNQGVAAIRAFRNGETRFTYTATLDARLQKRFHLAARAFTIVFDAYNVLNTATEVEEFPITGPTSRLTSAVQPPRAVHLGVRFTF